MIVLKFGGTSVRDASWMTRALEICEQQLDRAPLVVSSAMGKTTDTLIDLGRRANRGTDYANTFDDLVLAHRTAVRTLAPGAQTDLDALLRDLAALLEGVRRIRELSARTVDALLSFGERMATEIWYRAAIARGYDAVLLDSRKLLRTDSHFGNANLQSDTTGDLIRAGVTPQPGRLYIAQGFIASDDTGATTTLGRGGSDYTASIYGSALGAEQIQIWTDVDGIMSADPRLVPAARTVPEVGYAEAAELAYFGGTVIHPATILPAVHNRIPIVVGNTADPNRARTVIHDQPQGGRIRALTGRTGVTLISVRSSRMLNAYGYLSRIFATFEQHRISVDLLATSEVSVTVSIDDSNPSEAFIDDLSRHGAVEVTRHQAVISLIGARVWRDPALIARVFTTVKAVDRSPEVRMVSLGSSDTNLSLVVEADTFETVVRALHTELFDFEGGAV